MAFDLNQPIWSVLGSTEEYHNLKEDISIVCHDVTDAACIRELCMMDILSTLKIHGYVVMPAETKAVVEAAEAWADSEIEDEHTWGDVDHELYRSVRGVRSWEHDEDVTIEGYKGDLDDD